MRAQRRGQFPFPDGPGFGGASRGQRGPGRGGFHCDSSGRIEKRNYLFDETGKKPQKIEYDVFVSTRVNRKAKSPLIIALHGMNVPPASLLGCLTRYAEADGYIVAAPMGYDEKGYFGAGMQPPQDDPPNLSAKSEKDVMNVLDLMRKEFAVDENRIYIVGQSMGGAGALYLGIKHADIWAAVGASAPAITRAHQAAELEGAISMPFIVLHGSDDETVPVSRVLPWVDKMKALHMTYEYEEIPGAGHPDTIVSGAGFIFDFFNKHTRR
jgi:predicted peptidase